jgi:hypothetical protein
MSENAAGANNIVRIRVCEINRNRSIILHASNLFCAQENVSFFAHFLDHKHFQKTPFCIKIIHFPIEFDINSLDYRHIVRMPCVIASINQIDYVFNLTSVNLKKVKKK